MLGKQIQSDDPEVTAVLSRIVETVIAGGGQLHPTARLVAESGNLSLAAAPDVSDGEILVSMPRDLLIPTEDLVFENSTTEMRLTTPAEGLSEAQQQLLDLQIELYNLTEKIPETARNHPRFNTAWSDGAESALESLRRLVPESGLSAPEVFLSTRAIRFRDRSDREAWDAEPRLERVLMPIIDLANHHPKGRSFDSGPDGITLRVSRHGDQQCFAKYAGRKDLLDLALWYGYLDHNVTEAVSGRFELEIEKLGRIDVLGYRPKRKSELDPPVLEETPDGLKLSHLMFDEAAPSRFWATLTMALQVVLARRGETSTRVGTMVDSVAIGAARANIEALETLSRNADAHLVEPAAVLMAYATRRQAEIIASVVPDAA